MVELDAKLGTVMAALESRSLVNRQIVESPLELGCLLLPLNLKGGRTCAAARILNCLEPNAMRHLKQLRPGDRRLLFAATWPEQFTDACSDVCLCRHHLETALRWTSPDLTLLGEQTAQQAIALMLCSSC